MKNDELRKLAEAATPGPWYYRKGDEWSHSVVTHHGALPDGSPSCWTIASINKQREPEHEANAALIAAANPAKIIELLDTIEQQRKLLERARTTLVEIDLAVDLSKYAYAPGLTLLDQFKETNKEVTNHLRQQEGETK